MATRDEIYTAIRNADKAGDSAAVRKLGDYLKTLPAEGEAPKPIDASSTHEMALQRAKQFADQAAAERAKQPGIVARALNAYGDYTKGVLDTAGNLASGAVAAPVAGYAGVAQGIKNLVAPDPTNMSAADRVAQVQGALTYQPRSDVGKAAQANIAAPVQWLGDKADRAGQITTDVTGSPAAGTAVNAGIQMLPAVVAPEVRGAFSSVAGAAARAGRAAVAKTGIIPPVAAAAPAATAAVNPAALGTAKAYVANTLGLDWDALARATQDKLTSIAQTAGNFDNIDPVAIAREAKLQALPVPVPATAAALARDRAALRNEGNVAATTAGQPIADIHMAGNQALLDNLDYLKGKVSGSGATAATATTPEESGAVVQGALRQGEALSKADYKAAYKVPDTMAPDAHVSAQPLYDLLEGRPDIQRLGFLQSWLNKAKITKTTTTDGVTVAEQRPVSVAELRDLKEQAGEIMRTGGTDGLYAGKVYDAVQSAIKEHPEIKAAYDVADAKFSAHKVKYEDQGAVSDLVSNASRTDRTTALSNTVKAVTSGAPEEIRQIKQTLLTGNDAATRTAGRQAWREVRAQVIQQIKDDATKGVAPLEDGSPNLTPGALQQSLRRYGPQKLDEIFGPGTTRQLNAILDAAKDVKTIPPTGGGSIGSSTLQNALAFLEKGLIAGTSKVPLIGKVLSGGLQIASDAGGAARTVKTATTTPLNEALAKANTKASRADLARQAAGVTKLVPLSALGQRSQ